MKISEIPKGKVGIGVKVRVYDPEKRKNHKKMEAFLEKECIAYLKIRLDSRIMKELFK